jgi:protein-export membrane protein, SecD/SecF family/protein-export membrane protein SecD
MKKSGRLITILVVIALGIFLLYPTIKWYLFVPQATKDLATGSNVQIREYARGQAAKDVRVLMDLAQSDPNATLDGDYKYLITVAKENYKASGRQAPSSWTVMDVFAAFKNQSELFDVVESHYREPLVSLKNLSGKVLQLGLDLKGGMSILLDADRASYEEKLGRKATEAEITAAVTQDIEILNNRIDQFGVTDPDIRLQGTDQIQIEIPGASDPERVNSFLRGKGSLTFRMVDEDLTSRVNSYFANNPALAYNADGSIAQPDFIPSDKEVAGYYVEDEYGIDVLKSFAVLNREISLDGVHLESAVTDTDRMTGRPVVNFRLDTEGGNIFYSVTSKNVGKPLAVVMDGNIKSIATINDAISTNVQISGFSEAEAASLAVVLRTASLPIELKVASQQSIGATLGSDAVSAGIRAILFGLVLVMVFMVAYYSIAGLIADLALVLNLFLMVSVLSAFQFTVTLTSIAGLILTLGMAVDANVIIYERIKEELKLGKSSFGAVKSGFGKAFWTIMDSNVTTIIAALVLMQLGSSSVKGFAVTLAVGIAASLFTALFVSHLIFDLWITEDNGKNVKISWRKAK